MPRRTNSRPETNRFTIRDITREVERAEHRRLILWAMTTFLDEFRCLNGQLPQRRLYHNGRQVDADRAVVADLIIQMNNRVFEESRRIEELLEIGVSQNPPASRRLFT